MKFNEVLDSFEGDSIGGKVIGLRESRGDVKPTKGKENKGIPTDLEVAAAAAAGGEGVVAAGAAAGKLTAAAAAVEG